MRGWWKDTGRLEDMLEANRLILDNLLERVEGELIDSQVDGRVVIEAGARLERTTVRGPAIIGAGARLSDCYIGPYTAIGERCTISRLRGRAFDPAGRLHGLRPRRAHGVLAARAQRDGAPRRSPAARVPLHGRGQLRHLDPVSRSCSSSGRRGDARPRRAARGRARRPRARAAWRTPSSTSPTALPSRTRFAARRVPTRRINCAAWTDVDGAETHREQAHAVNADGAGNLARAAAAAGVPLVHVSTDYVFAGAAPLDAAGAPRPYVESDPTGPALGVRARPSSPASARCSRPRRGTRSCAALGCSV